MEGTVRTLRIEKGYGFVRSGGEDYFMHANDIIGLPWDETLQGRIVEFQPQQSSKGIRAVDVRGVE